MPPDSTKGGTLEVPPLDLLPTITDRPTTSRSTDDDTRLRVPAELIPPDRARRRGYLILLRHCPNCRTPAGGYVHAFRSPNYSPSYVRRPPCGGPELVLVTASFHLRQVAA